MNNSTSFSNEFLFMCPISPIYIVQNEFLIISIFMDLIAGFILSALTYQFYQGIEISHPVYSILFGNIVFSIVSSVISFCGAVYPYIGQSCVIFWLLNRYNNGSNVIVNIVSWATISILRYHLLITAKIENKQNELNLPRIRNISLIANWAIIVGMLTWNALFQMKLFIMPVTMVLLVLFNAGIFAVYYKMYLKLKEQQQSKEGKSHNDLEKRKNSGKPISLLFP